jgi:hypothetical protein
MTAPAAVPMPTSFSVVVQPLNAATTATATIIFRINSLSIHKLPPRLIDTEEKRGGKDKMDENWTLA